MEITKGTLDLTEIYNEEVGRIRYPYTGEEIELDFEEYNNLLNISGDIKATLPGKYQAVISIKNKNLYEYIEYYDAKQDDYITTNEDVTIEWEIEKVVTLQRSMTENKKYSYNGEKWELYFRDYSDLLDISGNIATLPGKYQAVISIKDKNLCEYIRYYDHKKGEWITTDEDITIDWEITKGIVSLNHEDTNMIWGYTGKEIILDQEVVYYSDLLNISGDIRATLPGKYQATISIKDKNLLESIRYYDATQEKMITSDTSVTVNWEIKDKLLVLEYIHIGSMKYSYRISEIVLHEVEEYSDLLNISGDIRATLPGKYQAVISIKDKNQYEYIRYYNREKKKWITTDENITIDWEITKGTIDLDYTYKKTNLVLGYTGEEITVIDGIDKYIDSINISGDIRATLPGKYQATISIKDKNLFKDIRYYDAIQEEIITSDTSVIINWEIREKLLVLDNELGYATYDGKEKKTLEIEKYSDLINISGDIKATLPGKYQAVISIKDKNLYEYIRYYDYKKRKWITKEDSVKLDWTIEKRELATYDGNAYDGLQFEYDGKEKVLDFGSYSDLINISGVSRATLPGKYQAKISIKNKDLNSCIYYYSNTQRKLSYSVTNENDTIINWEIKGVKPATPTTPTTPSTGNAGGSGGGGGGGGGSSSDETIYKPSIKQSKGGLIIVDNEEVEKGGKQVFTITPSDGYKIVDVKINGKSVGAVETYTIENVEEQYDITAIFQKLTEEELKEIEEMEKEKEKWNNPFNDVTSDDWYYESVEFVNKSELFKGLSDTEFGANVSMNRAMIVTVLHRLEGENEIQNGNIDFKDIPNGEYYSNAVIWAVENEIVNGVGDDSFAPLDDVTREQLVTILYRYAGYKKMDMSVGENTNILSYDDAFEISEYAVPAMQWAIENGIITGRTQTTLIPQGTATRAEVATIIMRFAKIMNDTEKLKTV